MANLRAAAVREGRRGRAAPGAHAQIRLRMRSSSRARAVRRRRSGPARLYRTGEAPPPPFFPRFVSKKSKFQDSEAAYCERGRGAFKRRWLA